MKSSPNTASKKNKPEPQIRSKSRPKSLSPNMREDKFYFCHYKNAMYMGGMKSFQRCGMGILLYDNGSSAVCSHEKDFKHGHNLVYTDQCIMSMIYHKNRVTECVFKDNNFLLFIRFAKEEYPEGKAVLLDYQNKGIIYALYKKGIIIEKRSEREFSVINRVFDLENLEVLIGITHAKALRHELEENENILSKQTNNKVNIGFYKRGLLNGLGFSFLIQEEDENKDSIRRDSFSIKPTERGYFHNSQLSGMGEKWFKNGNYYFGDFKDNIFEGRGLLKNIHKENWVYGVFEKGNMSELIEYSHEGETSRCKKLIELLHERKSSWINKEITCESPEIYMKEVCRIMNSKASSQVKSLHERKQDVLRKIQENFICDHQESNFLEQSRNIIEHNQISADEMLENHHEIHLNKHTAKCADYGEESHMMFPSGVSKEFNTPEKIAPSERKQEFEGKYTLKLTETRNKESSSRRKEYKEAMSSRSRNSIGLSPVKDESPSLKFDSKKMIGKSRLFKYAPNERQEDPPTFNFY